MGINIQANDMSAKRFFLIMMAFVFCLFSCSSKMMYYSRDGIEYQKVVKLYENVPVFEDSLVNDFIVKLRKPEYPESVRKTESHGIVYCQPLIDIDGEVVAIVIKVWIPPIVLNVGNTVTTFFDIFPKYFCVGCLR